MSNNNNKATTSLGGIIPLRELDPTTTKGITISSSREWLDEQAHLQSMELEAVNKYLIAILALGKLYNDYRFQYIDLEDTTIEIDKELISYRATAEYFGVSKDKVAQYIKAYKKRSLIEQYYNKDIHTSIKKVVGIIDTIPSQITPRGSAEDTEGYTPKDRYLQSLRLDNVILTNRKTQEEYTYETDMVNRPKPLQEKIRQEASDIGFNFFDKAKIKEDKLSKEDKLKRDLEVMTTKRVSAKAQRMYKEQTSSEAYTDYAKTLESFTSDVYTTKDIKSFLDAINRTKLNKGAAVMVKLMEKLLMEKIKLDTICDLEFMLEEYNKDK